jgi:mono/diheme cytochrome c family protein
MKAAAMLLVLFACAAILGACGSQGVSVSKDSPYYRGAILFRDHCSGCHTLSTVGAQGSATSIANRIPTNGPNFNIRKENAEQVLYAIRNGGFSGAIMPENIVVGKEAEEVANFLAAYSGKHRQSVPSVNIPAEENGPTTTATEETKTTPAAGGKTGTTKTTGK